MKKSFKIKKSVVESMVDDAICSLLNEEIDLGPYDSQSEKFSRVSQDTPEKAEIRKQIRRLRNMLDDCETDEEVENIRQKIAALKKKAGFDKVYEGFDYDDLSQDVMHWALNYADSGHDFPINAVQSMQEWYNGDDSALDTVCERFAEWKGIECDDNVRGAVEKAANTIGYYENWNNDKIEFDEAKESQAVEDMKKKIRSMSQKISSTDEELPELKRQVDALKNKLSTMDESFKSQKLKDFSRKHGGLKNGKWSASFENDLYNMSDEDFDAYEVVDQGEHYGKYGVNGTDTTGYTNNNFQPIEFGDGTFMVKKNPHFGWDERADNMRFKKFERYKGKKNDGKNEYQFENPYLNDKFNQEYHISKPRGSWGYGTDWKLEPNNINMTALRSMEGYDKYPKEVKPGDVAAKAKASRKGNVSESKLDNAIRKSIKKVLNEGIYGYPDGIDHIILLSENDRELYDEYRQIAKACMKLYKKDVQLSLERLMESSIMKRYQQHCFRKYAKEQQGLDRMNSPREFRRFIAEKIIDEVVNGDWDDREMMNEYYTDDPNDGYDYETGKPYYPGVYGYYSVNPEGVADEIEYAQNARNHQTGWAKRELDNRDKMMNAYVQGERSEDDIDDAWYGIHAFESKIHEEIEQPKQYGYQNVSDDFVEKVGENGYDVLVPDWCLPYLINGDRDVYEDDEIAAMDAFVEKYNGKLAHNLYVGDACMPMDGEEPSFYTHNDITGNEGCDCYRVFLPAKESEQMNEGVYPRVKDKTVQNLEWIKIPDDGWFDGGMSCGIIDHEKKTVTPCHGYYFPNPKSSVLRNIAKNLGYQYNDEEFEKYMQKKQNNKKS